MKCEHLYKIPHLCVLRTWVLWWNLGCVTSPWPPALTGGIFPTSRFGWKMAPWPRNSVTRTLIRRTDAAAPVLLEAYALVQEVCRFSGSYRAYILSLEMCLIVFSPLHREALRPCRQAVQHPDPLVSASHRQPPQSLGRTLWQVGVGRLLQHNCYQPWTNGQAGTWTLNKISQWVLFFLLYNLFSFCVLFLLHGCWWSVVDRFEQKFVFTTHCTTEGFLGGFSGAVVGYAWHR